MLTRSITSAWVRTSCNRVVPLRQSPPKTLIAAFVRSAEEPLQQLVPVHFQIGCDVGQNRGERADLEWAMRRNRYVMYGG